MPCVLRLSSALATSSCPCATARCRRENPCGSLSVTSTRGHSSSCLATSWFPFSMASIRALWPGERQRHTEHLERHGFHWSAKNGRYAHFDLFVYYDRYSDEMSLVNVILMNIVATKLRLSRLISTAPGARLGCAAIPCCGLQGKELQACFCPPFRHKC